MTLAVGTPGRSFGFERPASTQASQPSGHRRPPGLGQFLLTNDDAGAPVGGVDRRPPLDAEGGEAFDRSVDQELVGLQATDRRIFLALSLKRNSLASRLASISTLTFGRIRPSS